MVELTGKYNRAKVFTDLIEPTAIAQIINLLNQDWIKDLKIRVMSDVHAGAGCTIGTTMTIKDKIVPNLVGVDIGCLDKDTEVLTKNGWIYISQYNNEHILQYNKDTETANFEKPLAYIIDSCESFFHLESKYGLDQCVSDEHKMLVFKGVKNRGYKKIDYLAKNFVEKHNSLKKGIQGGVQSTFKLDTFFKINLTSTELRLLIMISADGCIRDCKDKNFNKIEIHLKKQRKIDRCISLLKKLNIPYRYSTGKCSDVYFNFKVKREINKDLTIFWKANSEQLHILADEVLLWGKNRQFFSTSIYDHANIVQFAFASKGIRCGIHKQVYKNNHWKPNYSVYLTKNSIVHFPPTKFKKVKSIDGKKYCFTMPTGYFVARRNNKIFITGNCGMLTAKLPEKELDLVKLDKIINKRIPAGFSIRKKKHCLVNRVRIEKLKCLKEIDYTRAEYSVGTLGGGNHFIEANKSSNDNIYLVIHTGSRNLGKQVAEYYQKLADVPKSFKKEKDELIAEYKRLGRTKEIKKALDRIKPPVTSSKKLMYLEGDLFDDYIHDMKIVQEYASLNRLAILDEIISSMNIQLDLSKNLVFQTIHNYIDISKMILRKGAVSSLKDEKLLIPINMRDGSLLCIGKGNPDWNFSAPHGAGRLFSRKKAKESFTLNEFKETMKGIYTTSIKQSTLDECPMAYKSINDIVDNIVDTVEIIDILKPIYNFKSS